METMGSGVTGGPASSVSGDVAPGFGAVADAFRRNFAEGREVGAALAVMVDGQLVVDLWGGYADGRHRRPWREDTLVPVFSTTKGVSAVALALLHSRGALDHDQPVAAYWPEFAQAGKAGVTVRQLLAHQAGLSGITRRLSLSDLADPDRLAPILAAQRPAWEPGTRHGYHGITLGWYEGELVRRLDPHHRTIGRFFADEVAAPLGLEFYIGLPDDLDRSRVATIHGTTVRGLLHNAPYLPWRFVLGMLNPRSAAGRAFLNPRALGWMASYNREEIRRLELPASNGTGQVRSIAALYGEVATGGGRLGLAPTTLEALTRPAVPPTLGSFDVVLGVDTSFSLGYLKPFPSFPFGGERQLAFGTPGAGGSFGFADPEFGLGYGYAMNRAGYRLVDDPRELPLRDVLYRALGGPPQTDAYAGRTIWNTPVRRTAAPARPPRGG